MPDPSPRSRRALSWGLGGATLALGGVLLFAELRPPAVAEGPLCPDLAPLYLGGWALREGLDPADREVHADLWLRETQASRPGQFFNPYPATASLLALPLTAWPWKDLWRPWWTLSGLALAAAALAAPGLAARRPSGPAWMFGAGAGLALLAGLDATRHNLHIGQANPLMVAVTVLAAVLLVRDRQVPAGVVVGLGAALKLFPGLLLLAALATRRWRALAAAAVTLGLLATATACLHPGWDPRDDLARAWLQVTVAQAHRDPPLWGLWRYRAVPAGLGLAWALAWAWRRAQDAEARQVAVMAALAFGAASAGGLAPPHESLLVAPALLAALAAALRGERGPALVGGACLLAAWTPPGSIPVDDLFSQDHGRWLILLAWAALGTLALRARRPPG